MNKENKIEKYVSSFYLLKKVKIEMNLNIFFA